MKQAVKTIQNLALAASLVFSMGMAIVPVKTFAATSVTAAPRVTFTFDDGLASTLNLAAPIMKEYGITGTNYIITNCVGMTTAPNTCKADQNRVYMDWNQINTLRTTYGWNIGSHTADHICLASTCGGEQTMPTAAEVTAQIVNSKNALKTAGFDALDFAAPYGDYDNTVLAEVAKQYATFRGFADTGYNIWPYNDLLIVNQQIQEGARPQADSAVSVDAATAKGYIDTAIANKQWLTLTFHEITEAVPTSSDNYTTSTALLREIAAYVKQKVDAGQISVVSPHDAIVSGTNMLGDGSFDTTTLSTDAPNRNSATLVNGWVTDDTTGTLIKKDSAGNGRFTIGSTTGATNSLYISANAANAHVWAPRVAVNPATTYIIKGFFNITTFVPGAAAQPEVAYYVDEYNASGALMDATNTPGYVNPYSSAVRYDPANVNAIRVKEATFAYKPTAGAAYARIYVSVQGGGGITGFMDNLEMIDPNGTATPTVPTTPSTGKVGDLNGDGTVGLNDLSILSNNWKKTGATASQGDLNGDGTVNLNDLSILSSNWGK